MSEFVCFESAELKKVERVMKKLFLERRMNGDEMRDAAQTLESFLRQAIPYDEPSGGGVGDLPSWAKR